MELFLWTIIVSLILVATNPVSMTYVGFALIHIVVMFCYLDHPNGCVLALCAGLTSALYLFLAFQHVLA